MLPRADVHAQMLSLRTDGRCLLRTHVPHAEDRAWVSHPVRLQQSQFLHCLDGPVRGSGKSRNGDLRDKVLRGQSGAHRLRKGTAKVRETLTGECQPCRHCVSAELDECVTTGGKCLVEMQSRDAAARTFIDIVPTREDNARAIIFFDQAGCHDADHARVPFLSCHDDGRNIGGEIRQLQLRLR